MKMDLSHIMLIEFEEQIGSYRMEQVMLFNENRITEADALSVARTGEYNENVLIISKRQWISLFRDGKEDDIDGLDSERTRTDVSGGSRPEGC